MPLKGTLPSEIRSLSVKGLLPIRTEIECGWLCALSLGQIGCKENLST